MLSEIIKHGLVTNQAMFNYFRYKSGLKSRTFRIYTDDQQMINERSYGMQSVCSLQMTFADAIYR